MRRPCLEPGCNVPTDSTRCAAHTRKGRPFAGARERYDRLPEKLRQSVLSRDGRRCTRCGARTELEVDHIVPVSRGGEHVASNLRTLCRTCHRRHTGQTFGWKAGRTRGAGGSS